MDRASAHPPRQLLDTKVTRVNDFRTGGEQRPRWLENTNLVELVLGERGRILIRPSGTEPKLKVYVDLRRPLSPGTDVWPAESELQLEARSFAEAAVKALGLD
jgi:phosphomannomutase